MLPYAGKRGEVKERRHLLKSLFFEVTSHMPCLLRPCICDLITGTRSESTVVVGVLLEYK